MNLYLLTQTENTCFIYYDSAVVVASDEEAAKLVLPYKGKEKYAYAWAGPKDIKVQLLGSSLETAPRLVMSSYRDDG